MMNSNEETMTVSGERFADSQENNGGGGPKGCTSCYEYKINPTTRACAALQIYCALVP